MFHFMYVHIIFSSAWVAERPSFVEKAAYWVDDIFPLYFDYLLFNKFKLFAILECWIWVLIAIVPDLCILFTFIVLP